MANVIQALDVLDTAWIGGEKFTIRCEENGLKCDLSRTLFL